MRVDVKNIKPGAWLVTRGRYAQFAKTGENEGEAYVQFHGEDNHTVVRADTLRPVFINPHILALCGFKKQGGIYSDGFFEITVGGKENLYVITGRRIKKPSASHLLSKLHMFQEIYHSETGRDLAFHP